MTAAAATKPGQPPAARRYADGDRVRVRKAEAPGHIRTPHYIRGRTGTIERYAGCYKNPEELAYGRSGEPKRNLYRVRFLQREVWPDYAGAAGDTLDIDLYEHWLEPAGSGAP